jgi:hypothetical protein
MLYVYLLGPGATLAVARLSARGAERLPILDERTTDQFFRDDGGVVASVRKGDALRGGRTYVVNGSELSDGRFDVDPGGEWFLWGREDAPSEIRRTADPSRSVTVSSVKGERIFRHGNTLFVWGRPTNAPSDATVLGYQVFKVAGDTVHSDGEGRLVSPSWVLRGRLSVIDMDPVSGAALIEEQRDDPLCSRWYVWEPDQPELKDVGCSAEHGVFMNQNVISVSTASTNTQASTASQR